MRKRNRAERTKAKTRKRHLAVTAGGQTVAVTDTGMIIGHQVVKLAPIIQGWPKESHTRRVMEFMEIWGGEGLAAVMSPKLRYA